MYYIYSGLQKAYHQLLEDIELLLQSKLLRYDMEELNTLDVVGIKQKTK